MSIAFDIDGVVCDSITTFYESAKQKWNKPISNSTYQIKIRGISSDEIFHEYMGILIHENEKMFPYINAVESLRIFAKYLVPLTFVTSRPEHCLVMRSTMEWLKTYLQGVKFNIIFTDNKLEYIQEQGFKYFVEDRYKTANQLAKNNIQCFLVNREWNMNRQTHKNVTRVNDLKQVFEIFYCNGGHYDF